jgi:hypothetical protein
MLVEALTALLLLGVLFAAFSALSSEVSNRNSTLVRQTYLAEQVRPTLDTMALELQGAMCNGAVSPVTLATPTQITFTTPDRQNPFHLRQITYSLVSGTLRRQFQISTTTTPPAVGATWPFGPWTPAAPATVIENVTNTTVFHYYDAASPTPNDLGPTVTGGSNPTNLQKIAKVTATITVTPPASGGSGTLTAQATATLRTPWTADCA